ncbi:MAG: hypothetical protein PHI18_07890 [bacterium]|nr:hypothetical protein [bacterium]
MKTARRREEFDMREDDGPRDEHDVPQATGFCLLRKGPMRDWLDLRTFARSERKCQALVEAITDTRSFSEACPAMGVVMVTVKAEIRN